MHNKISASAIKSFALLLVLGSALLDVSNQAAAQAAATPSTTTPYAKMAPIDRYLMAEPRKSPWRGVRHRSPFHAMQKSWFLGGMVSKQRSKARTASCVSWGAGGHPLPMLTIGIRKCESPCV
jgi:hypothetical protein